MSEITVPDSLILDQLGLFTPTQVNRSAWTGARKVVGLPGAEVWRGKATIEMIATESEERAWRAFLFGLRGPQNWFRWVLPCATHAGSKPTVDSASTTGYDLPLTGIAVSTTILVAGQFMTVPLPSGRYRAVMLTADLTSDGSGDATAAFVPALTEAPTVGATVETKDPFVPMALVDPFQAIVTSQGVATANFDVEEAR